MPASPGTDCNATSFVGGAGPAVRDSSSPRSAPEEEHHFYPRTAMEREDQIAVALIAAASMAAVVAVDSSPSLVVAASPGPPPHSVDSTPRIAELDNIGSIAADCADHIGHRRTAAENHIPRHPEH